MRTGLEMAHRDPSSLILGILYQFNDWCKIGTYVSLFCKSFIILRWPSLFFIIKFYGQILFYSILLAGCREGILFYLTAFSSWNLFFPHWLNDHCQLTQMKRENLYLTNKNCFIFPGISESVLHNVKCKDNDGVPDCETAVNYSLCLSHCLCL